MSALDRQVQVARRRLFSNLFFASAAAALLFAAGAWALTVLITRAFALGLPLGYAAVGVSAAGLLAAVVWALRARPTALTAAAAVDRAAGLKERLSTALAVRSAADPFAQAVVRDAESTAGRIHVPSHVPLRAPALWPWSAATLLAAILLTLFMPTLDLLAGSKQKPAEAADAKQVKTEREAISTQVQSQLKQLQALAESNPGLKDLADSIEPFELPDTPAATPEDVRRDALKAIDNVMDKLQRERKEAEDDGLSETKKLLSQLQPTRGSDPASKLGESLSQGDMQAAQEALKELQDQAQEAAQKAESPEAKAQLEQMQQLQRMADELAKLSDTTQIEKELENKGGMSAEEAKKLAEQLSKMDPKELEKALQQALSNSGMTQQQMQELKQKIQQQQKAQKQCQNMSQAMQQAAQALQQCQNPGNAQSGSQAASQALSNAASQLSQMEMAEQMMNELQAQMADMQDLKDKVRQGQCQGGNGEREGEPSGIGNQGPQAGRGVGSRIGKEKIATDLKPEKAETRTGKGQIIGKMMVDGPQVKGEARAAVSEAATAALRDATDAIETNTIPRQYERILRTYFERLAGISGAGGSGASADAEEPKK